MRLASALVPLLAAVAPAEALACPEAPASGAAPCAFAPLSFDRLRHVVDLGYAAGITATADTSARELVDASAGLGLRYTAQFGDVYQPEYELAIGAGVAAHRLSGAAAATGVTTHVDLRLGPAVMATGDTDNQSLNAAWFPLSFEVAHDGDLAALPRLSARPDVLRGVFGREQVTAATRVLRVEWEDDGVSDGVAAGPGARVPRSTSFDLVPLRAGVDATMQGGLRLETVVAGALFGGAGRGLETGALLSFLEIEHRAIRLPSGAATAIDTLWVARLDFVNPRTGTRYFAGWGEVMDVPGHDALLRYLDKEDNGTVAIGGLGWWHDRTWGGVGWQYRREPYVTMAAEPALEDRVSAEVYRTGKVTVAGRWFGARTLRLVDETWQRELTTGLEADVSRQVKGVDVALRVEVGRSYYAALDDAAPAVGFAARAALSIQRTGTARWSR